jgi:hypothetical protein
VITRGADENHGSVTAIQIRTSESLDDDFIERGALIGIPDGRAVLIKG